MLGEDSENRGDGAVCREQSVNDRVDRVFDSREWPKRRAKLFVIRDS